MKLYLGDCLDVMKNIPDQSIDFICVDPPYGTTKCPWDVVIPFQALWEEYHRIIKPNGAIAIFGQEPFSSLLRCSNLAEYKFDWYWEKERLTNISQVKRRAGKTIETISMFYAKQPTYNPQMQIHEGPLRTNKIKDGKLGSLVDEQNKRPNEYHDTGLRYPTQVLRFQRDCLTCNLQDTQKPVALLEFLIKTYTNPGEVVLDSCMGSGSTGVACLNTDREFIGIEKKSEHFAVAQRRLLDAGAVLE
jgi:site-specific DNA-methyltransferase (adenine-specific)